MAVEGGGIVDILRTRGEGKTVLRFCADIFYGRPLKKRVGDVKNLTLVGYLLRGFYQFP